MISGRPAQELRERLKADLPRKETMVINTGNVGGGIATVTSERVWYRAYSSLAWLAKVWSVFTEHGDNWTGYRVGPYAGTAQGDKLWGRNLTKRAESGSVAAADPAYTQVDLSAHKQGFDVFVSSESLDDVDGLAAALEYGSGYAVGLDASLQLVNGDGTGQGTGLRTVLSQPEQAARKVTTGANAPTLDQTEEMYFNVPAKARAMPSCCWLTSDANLQAWKKSTRGSDGHPEIVSTARSAEYGAEGELMGKLVFTAPGFPAFAADADVTAVFGPLDGLVDRWVTPIRFVASDDGDRWTRDQTAFRVMYRFDCTLVDPDSWSFVSGS